MKIVFLNRYQTKVERGAEVFIAEIAKRLRKRHQVDIFSNQDADSLSKVLGGKYDIVVPVNGRFQSIKFSFARIIGKYKILITGHSGKGWDDILNILVKPDIFVALTDFLAKWAKSWAWGTKVIKIPNGIDLEKFSPTGSKLNFDLPKPIILSVGALTWYKHHDLVIQAVYKLGFGSLIIVGRGEGKNRLQSLGQKLLGNRFRIFDFNFEDMPKVYRSCDLFTLPSWDREAFGLVYLEALASGLGVVAPDDQTRREVIGEAGLLVNTADSEIYTEALKSALTKNWTKQARQQAEKFSWDEVAERYEKVMLDLLLK